MTLVYQSTRDAKNAMQPSKDFCKVVATDGGLFVKNYPKVDLDFDTLKD